METTQTPVSRMHNRVDILINDFKIKFGLSKIGKGQAAAVGQVEVTFWVLSPHLSVPKFYWIEVLLAKDLIAWRMVPSR